ncbi:MAG: hypothetical protein FJX75_15430 [Armatimonadetes bacterium]|nr:hypothetical protein [Armatimonadota bacterium]
MSITSEVLTKLCQLPPEKQRMVLEYVESLREGDLQRARRPLRSLRGLLADQKVDITDEDIAEARREMWGAAALGVHP